MSSWTLWCSRPCDYMVRSTLLCFFGLWWPSGHKSQESSLFMILRFIWSWELYFHMDLRASFKYILISFESSTGVSSNAQVDIKNQKRTQKLILSRSPFQNLVPRHLGSTEPRWRNQADWLVLPITFRSCNVHVNSALREPHESTVPK